MKSEADSDTSPEFQRFDKAMRHLLSVPHSELQRRMEEYRKQSDANPRKRGPKRKTKPDSEAKSQ